MEEILFGRFSTDLNDVMEIMKYSDGIGLPSMLSGCVYDDFNFYSLLGDSEVRVQGSEIIPISVFKFFLMKHGKIVDRLSGITICADDMSVLTRLKKLNIEDYNYKDKLMIACSFLPSSANTTAILLSDEGAESDLYDDRPELLNAVAEYILPSDPFILIGRTFIKEPFVHKNHIFKKCRLFGVDNYPVILAF